MKCYICNIEKDNFSKLSNHIRRHHSISSKEYYDTYLKKENDGICIGCGCKTNFQDLNNGYHKMCSSRKCSCKYNRKQLKNNPIKFKKFRENVSNNMKTLWKDMSLEEKNNRMKNANIKQKEWIQTLNEEERSLTFGWLNKLSQEEKEKKIKDVLIVNLRRWWNEASIEVKKKTREKMLQTKVKNGVCVSLSNSKDFISYTLRVRSLTEKNYRIYKSFINPNNLKRSRKIQLDHKVSIHSGYMLGLPEKLIASPFNLELLEGFTNNSKHTKNSITIEELWELHSKMESLPLLIEQNT